jgi:hypothetical protein
MLMLWAARHRNWKARLTAWLDKPWLHWPEGMCVHHYEGSWTAYNPAGPYFGGFQMNSGFMTRWGSDMLRKYGGRDARSWSPADQLHVAWRAEQSIGWGPWPNTARACGLL